MEGQAVTAIRLNPFKGCEGPEGTPVPWSPYGRILAQRPNFTLDPLFHAGCYYVQDSSSMYVGHVFRKLLGLHPDGTASEPVRGSAAHPSQTGVWAPPPNIAGGGMPLGGSAIRVLDLCAAPGGKTTDLAASLREAFGDAFELLANEVIRSRASVLADNVGAWGDPAVTVTSVDPAVMGKTMRGYFDVVVADVPCSGEGMFGKDPRARKEWSPQVVELCAARQKRILADVWPALREGGLLLYSTCTYEDAENDSNLEWAAENLGGEIIAPENEFAPYGVRMTRHGNLLKEGEVPGGGQWVGALRKTSHEEPDRRADMASLRPFESRMQVFDASVPRVELDLQQALRYLHRDALSLPEAPQGLLAVCYRSHPLGFVKNIGSRCNNLYPRSRRIIMDI